MGKYNILIITTHYSPLTTHHSPLTTYHPPPTTHHPAIINYIFNIQQFFNETKAIAEYVEYINGFDTSRMIIESEVAKNSKFKDYLERCRVGASPLSPLTPFLLLLSSREFLLPLTFYLYTNASQQAAPECKNLTIDQYLIMPIQRVPRHILLLTDLIKHTPPEHPDFAALSKAVERAKEVAVVFNDAKGRALSNTKVCAIS